MFRDRSGRVHVAEVEGTEPSLFFPDPFFPDPSAGVSPYPENWAKRAGAGARIVCRAGGYCDVQVNMWVMWVLCRTWILCRMDKHVMLAT